MISVIDGEPLEAQNKLIINYKGFENWQSLRGKKDGINYFGISPTINSQEEEKVESLIDYSFVSNHESNNTKDKNLFGKRHFMIKFDQITNKYFV